MPGISISRTNAKIVLDGHLDESAWENAEVAGEFRQYFPSDTSLAMARTEVRIMYDDRFIYIGAIMYNEHARSYVTPSLRRDYRGSANDGFTVVFDPFKDRTNGYLFGINPFGVQREGLIASGGDLSLTWDNKWYGQAYVTEAYWSAEMAIPFKTLRFKEGLSSWNINFYRIDSDLAERSSWSPIPRNFALTSMAFNRELRWDRPLKKSGPNVSVIPYGLVRQSRDFEQELPVDKELNVGADAKVAMSSSLNLDLTANPDFSQVDTDQQVTNLDRFEIFYPEKRQFFLENADLFANFGMDNVRPFFSRRIGVARDSSTGANVQNQILGGARLSGKINNNLRVGLLNMQGGKDPELHLPSTNYTVATFQQKVFARSNFGMIFVNKQAFQDSIGSGITLSPSNYNRLIGFDYNLASRDNTWNGKIFYHRSFSPNNPDSTFASGANLSYNTLKWSVSGSAYNVGANYNPEVGYNKRSNYMRLTQRAWYNFYPAAGGIQSYGPGLDYDVTGNKLYGVTDYDYNLMFQVNWKSTANFNTRLRREYVYLFSPFDPTNTESQELASGTGYSNFVFIANYNSDARKRLFYQLSTRSGGYFNGTRANVNGTLSYRFQPYGIMSLNFTYNGIRLPSPYASADLLLIGPKFDITFSRQVFWTTYLQYNSQINNLNIQSRLQWRFKPVSDLFIVYTDNYFAESFQEESLLYIGRPKFRALVLKLTYWLNL